MFGIPSFFCSPSLDLLTFRVQSLHIHSVAKLQLPTWVFGSSKELREQILLSGPYRLLGWHSHGWGTHWVIATLLTTGILPILGPQANKEVVSTLG